MYIFDGLINVLQSVVYTKFLTECLGIKEKFKKWQVYIGMFIPLFTYLEIQKIFVLFEGFAIFSVILISLLLSCIFCKADIVTSLLYNIIISILAMFSVIIGGSIVAIINNNTYMRLMESEDKYMVIAAILIQAIWILLLFLVLKIRRNRFICFDKKSTCIAIVIPILSVVICTIISTKIQFNGANDIWNIIVVIVVLLFNVVTFQLLNIMNNGYEKNIEHEIIIHSYKQQIKDIETIKDENINLEKNRHEMKKILRILAIMIKDNEIDKAMEYLSQIDVTNIISCNRILFTDNLVLNYVLNRAENKCKKNGIDFTCTINGNIDGIKDIDLHILLENLLDNAFEAIEKVDHKALYVAISSNDTSISIEIINSIKENVLVNNPKFTTTKNDADHHGFGMKNIRDIVNKYKGIISYEYVNSSSLKCGIILIKKQK